jgi:hypothetical protein
MKKSNLITVKRFADNYPSQRNVKGVSPAYIYKLIAKGKNSNFELVIIDGRHFINVFSEDKK